MQDKLTDLLRVEGVHAKGYGMIPKLVMQDKRITIEAKSIYSYFCSYAGAGTQAFPSVPLILEHLKIDKKRYYKHLSFLKTYGYIKIEQTRDRAGSKFSRNLYTLCTYPEEMISEEALEENPEAIEIQGSAPSTQIDTTDNFLPSTQIAPTQKTTTQNAGTQIPPSNINTLSKLTPFKINNQSVSRVPKKKTDGQTETFTLVEAEIKEQIGYTSLCVANDTKKEILDEIVLSMIDMRLSKNCKVNGELKPQETIKSVLSKITYWHVDHILESISEYPYEIKNMRDFMRTSIYNSAFEQKTHVKNVANTL